MAYPEFIIGEPGPGRHGPTWTAIRKNPAQPGLYAAVTPDLAELRDILASHQADASDPGTRPSTSHSATTGTAMPLLPPPSDPAPACHRNPGSPADQALATIVSLLAVGGYSFSIPSWDGDAYLRIDNAVQALTDLTITSHGDLTWEYRSFRYPHTSPDRLISTTVELLDPGHTRPDPAVPPEYANAPLLGGILHALTGYGFTVTVTETGADTRFVLTVTNPAQPWRGSILLTGDGELQWNTRAPHHRDGGIPLPDIAATINRALTRAHHPATHHHPVHAHGHHPPQRVPSPARPSVEPA